MAELIQNPYVQILALIVGLAPLGAFLYQFSIKAYKALKNKIVFNIQRKYYGQLDTYTFITWRDYQLKKIYGDQFFTEIFGHTYPTFQIPFGEYYRYHEFKAKNVYSKDDVKKEGYEIKNGEVVFPEFKDTPVMSSGTITEITHKRQLLRKYKRIVGASIKYPKLAGFSLDHYDFNENGKIIHIYPKLSTYEYNVYSSHILEFELFEAYKKLKGKMDVPIDTLWTYLPFRHYIHFGDGVVDAGKEVLYSGIRRYSLFSVQCIVVFKDKNHNEYHTLLMKRSTDPTKVAAKLGYYQFFPAGGFELYEKELIHSMDMIKENYSLRKAIFREYLEEVFNEQDFKAVTSDGNSETTDRILNHPKILTITDMIEKGSAILNLLGVTVDLVTLRHEISFVLRIDEENYSHEKFCPNDEFTRENSAASKVRTPLSVVEKLLGGEGFSADEAPKFNQSSALLYKMFKESPFYIKQ